MDALPPNVRKLQHSETKHMYFMRFGAPSERFARDGEPASSVFTQHGKPRQVSIAYAPPMARIPPDGIDWDPDVNRTDWAYMQRHHFVEIE